MKPVAFDALAPTYDSDFTHSLIGAAQRRTVWDVLDPILAQRGRPCRVLEINCGTGEDALHMAAAGHRVLATDVSASMLRLSAAKLDAAGLQGLAQVHMLDLQALACGTLTPAAWGGPFDLVLSNFGGLNCLSPDTLAALAKPLSDGLVQGGELVTVVMPRACLWEGLWGALRLRPRLASRRWRGGPAWANLAPESADAPLAIWYPGLRALERQWAPHFTLLRRRAVGLFVPPSYLEHWARRAPGLLRTFETMDRHWFTAGLWAPLADHALLHWRKRAP